MPRMDSKTIRSKYIKFFEARGHAPIEPAKIVLENDPTTLFTSAGMQPLVPYLKGEAHPSGNKLVDSQPCFRSQDIEEVGNYRHTTLFEMLGNWSLGDYFKKEQINFVWEFLTRELGINSENLHVTVFEGTPEVDKDEESYQAWKKLGLDDSHIHFYSVKKNWWSLTGTPSQMKEGDIGGPNSEVFYEYTHIPHDTNYGEKCHPNCDCGRFTEIGNSVFIQFIKESGKLKELSQKNVDFGGGLERLVASTNNEPDIFKSDLFLPIVEIITKNLNIEYEGKHQTNIRIIADHLKAATFLIVNGVTPSNKLQGYLLRRLLRRSAVKIHQITGELFFLKVIEDVVDKIFDMYDAMFGIDKNDLPFKNNIYKIITEEVDKFSKSLDKGIKEIEKLSTIDGKIAFDLYQSFGFPLELTEEIAKERKLEIDKEQFTREFDKHKELSRSASVGIFKGGLASSGDIETKYHTATHLLHQALRTILGDHVIQRGSNITTERMRFDFSHDSKLTDQELKQVEDLVNQKIQKDLIVSHVEMEKTDAEKTGAIHAFGGKYGDRVTVYSVGDFSKEFCGGPHVEHTSVLGNFKIDKEESVSSGIRRIYATLQ